MRVRSHVSGLALLPALVAGCATLTTARTQPLAVVTDPAGARCTVTHAGKVLGVVEATPGAIELTRGTDFLELTCRREGYLDERELVEVVNTAKMERYEEARRKRAEELAAAERAAAEPPASEVRQAVGTVATVAVGVGLVAVLLPFAPLFQFAGWVRSGSDTVDYLSGAVYQYEAPYLVLTPETFSAEPDREAHFVRRAARAEAMAERTRMILDPRLYCDVRDSERTCATPRSSVDAALAWRLAELERQRALTRIDPNAAATP